MELTNNISVSTYYQRLKRGMTKQEAATLPAYGPLSSHLRSPYKDTPRSKRKTFTLFQEDEEKFEKKLREANMPMSDFVAEIIHKFLKTNPNKGILKEYTGNV